MAKCLVGAVGGLPAADKAKLLPENIRKGVTIAKVTGTLEPADELDVLATMRFSVGAYNAFIRYWNGSTYAAADVSLSSATISGTIKKVIIIEGPNCNICGHSGVGVFTSGHTNTISNFGSQQHSFVVLGRK
ncbi:hypothetical protein [Candidatus Allofournierella excrementavium]|uniref:hypothetical protein n=1 Tax=Candidatus Allofournierella excrementavium TaxID=2838591 RepID=UPI003AB512D9